MVDAACKLDRGLHELRLNRNQLPSNVEIRQETPDLDQLFSDVLFCFCYQYGMKVDRV